ncbi:MAG: hypothetical protein HC828_15200 [Blastochloris sp.]|nr:hypothetical protein [Blastochloris sp.]
MSYRHYPPPSARNYRQAPRRTRQGGGCCLGRLLLLGVLALLLAGGYVLLMYPQIQTMLGERSGGAIFGTPTDPLARIPHALDPTRVPTLIAPVQEAVPTVIARPAHCRANPERKPDQ